MIKKLLMNRDVKLCFVEQWPGLDQNGKDVGVDIELYTTVQGAINLQRAHPGYSDQPDETLLYDFMVVNWACSADVKKHLNRKTEMCKKCLAAVQKYFPKIPETQRLDLLLGATVFPFGDADTVERQLRNIADNTDGTLQAAVAYADSLLTDECEEFKRNEQD